MRFPISFFSLFWKPDYSVAFVFLSVLSYNRHGRFPTITRKKAKVKAHAA